MPIRHILAVIGGSHADADILDLAWQIGAPDEAHIAVLHVRHDRGAHVEPGRLERLMDGFHGLEIPAEEEAVVRELAFRESRADQVFKLWRKRHDLPLAAPGERLRGPGTSWRIERTSQPAALVHLARVADLTILLRSTAIEIDAAPDLDETLFHTGRGALLVPPTQLHPVHKHAVIAWNGGTAASRTIAMALPLLARAEIVSLFYRPEAPLPQAASLAALRRYLAWHGIEAAPVAVAHPDLDPGADLLATCRAVGATLLVMGAYTHRRAREMMFGGVTQHVLEHAAIPVLMAH